MTHIMILQTIGKIMMKIPKKTVPCKQVDLIPELISPKNLPAKSHHLHQRSPFPNALLTVNTRHPALLEFVRPVMGLMQNWKQRLQQSIMCLKKRQQHSGSRRSRVQRWWAIFMKHCTQGKYCATLSMPYGLAPYQKSTIQACLSKNVKT